MLQLEEKLIDFLVPYRIDKKKTTYDVLVAETCTVE